MHTTLRLSPLALVILVVAAQALAAADPDLVALPQAIRSAGNGFLAVTEATVLTVVPKSPVPIDAGGMLTLPTYLRRCGAASPGFALADSMMDAHVIRLGAERLAVIRVSTVYVRSSQVAVIDGRPASLFAFPPMPAPGTDGKGAGMLPMPEAIGVSIAAGTARVFCGVRTGRVLDPNAGKSISVDDVRDLSLLLQTPTPETVLTLVAQ